MPLETNPTLVHRATSFTFFVLFVIGVAGAGPTAAGTVFPPPGAIATVVGGTVGDGGPALQAVLEPYGIALKHPASADLYIADRRGHRVRKLDGRTGEISTVAGIGVGGFAGDGGPATAARLYEPMALAFDSSGNLYIAEFVNRRIRRVDTYGTITTVAGNGSYGFSGDGGPATAAAISTPYDVTVDTTGTLFIADFDNHRIRKVSPSGIITTVAGNGSGGMSGDDGPATQAAVGTPAGVSLDSTGNLYVVSYLNSVVRRVNAAGIIHTVAGVGYSGFSGDGGPAKNAALRWPLRVAFDAGDNLLILDRGNNRLRRVDAATGIIGTVAGNGTLGSSGDGGPAVESTLYSPSGLAADAMGNVFLGTSENSSSTPWSYNNRIRVIAPNGIIDSIAGLTSAGDGSPPTLAILDPQGTAVSPAGDRAYIADRGNHTIRRVEWDRDSIDTIAGTGTAGFSGDGGLAKAAMLNLPVDVAVDNRGIVWVADYGNHRIRRIDEYGKISTVAGNGSGGYGGDGGDARSARLYYPQGVAVDGAGTVYIADTTNNRVRRVSTTGIITTVAGTGTPGSGGDGGPATQAQLMGPTDVVVGSDGSLYIAEKGGNRIRRVTPSGTISTFAGTGAFGFSGDGGPATAAQLYAPMRVALGTDGSLLIGDSQNRRVRRVNGTTGVITTVAGNGTGGTLGDGGPATQADLHPPVGVDVDPAGYLFVSQSESARIRAVALQSGAPDPTGTATRTPTPTPLPQTPTRTATGTPTRTATPTAVPSWTSTPTRSATATPSRTSTPSFTPSRTATPTFTPTRTPTLTPSWTSTPTRTPTFTPTRTATPTFTPTRTPTRTPSQTSTPTHTPSFTPTRTATPSFTPTRTPTRTPSWTSTPTHTPSFTPTRTATPTFTPTRTPTRTPSWTSTPTHTPTRTPTWTYTPTRTATSTLTPPSSPTRTFTPTNTATLTPPWTATPSRTPSFSPTTNPTATPVKTATHTATAVPTPTVPPTHTATPQPTPSVSAVFSLAGNVRYHTSGEPVTGATVILVGPTPAWTNTDPTGQFGFDGIAPADWRMEPSKLGDVGAAVSALDAALVLQNVVGLKPLSAEQTLAADVSGNGTASAFDASLILLKVVGTLPEFPVADRCGSEWVFIPQPEGAPNQQCTAPAPAGCTAGCIAFTPLTASAAGQNFEAVTYGDVSGNWQPTDGGAAVRAPVRVAPSRIELGRPRHRGRQVRVPVRVSGPDSFRALEIAVAYDAEALRFRDVHRPHGGAPTAVATNTSVPGVLRVAFASGESRQPGDTLMLHFDSVEMSTARPQLRLVNEGTRVE